MRTLCNVVIGVAVAFHHVSAIAREPSDILLAYGLEEIEPPGRYDWVSKYQRDRPLHVRIEKNALVVSHFTGKESRTFPPRYETSSIRYIGTDRGEWGGELLAQFADGTRRTLLTDNIVSIVPRLPSLLVFSGLSHGRVIGRGAIHRITSISTNPRVELVTPLTDAPRVVLEDPKRPLQRLFIVGTSSLTSIRNIGNKDLVEIHARGPSWAGHYPTSAVFYNDYLVIASLVCVVVVHFDEDEVSSVQYFAPKANSALLHSPPQGGPSGPTR